MDLGFSSLECTDSTFLKDTPYKSLQFTFVDCPGHASLIKTIISGAQIIDLVILVVDVTKGIQTQTAECIVIAEICASQMIIVLNKIDLVEPSLREKTIQKVSDSIKKALQSTKFSNSRIVYIYILLLLIVCCISKCRWWFNN